LNQRVEYLRPDTRRTFPALLLCAALAFSGKSTDGLWEELVGNAERAAKGI